MWALAGKERGHTAVQGNQLPPVADAKTQKIGVAYLSVTEKQFTGYGVTKDWDIVCPEVMMGQRHHSSQ